MNLIYEKASKTLKDEVARAISNSHAKPIPKLNLQATTRELILVRYEKLGPQRLFDSGRNEAQWTNVVTSVHSVAGDACGFNLADKWRHLLVLKLLIPLDLVIPIVNPTSCQDFNLQNWPHIKVGDTKIGQEYWLGFEINSNDYANVQLVSTGGSFQ